MKIEVNNIMNFVFLFGIVFNIVYWYKKYYLGIICKGVSNLYVFNVLFGCEKEEKLK